LKRASCSGSTRASRNETKLPVAAPWGLQIQLPTLIEGIDNGIGDAYGATPVRQYVIGKDGVVTYHGGAGPHFLDLDDWSEAIKSTIS